MELGITQEQLAELCDSSQATVARWENGSQLPPVNRLIQLARILKTIPAAFLPGGDGLSEEERELVNYLRAHPDAARVISMTYKGLRGDDVSQKAS